MPPRICVIIATFNGRQYLPELLSSLKNVDYPSDRWGLVVVDNASTDDTVAYLRQQYPTAHGIALNENTGFAAANNVGLRYAMGHDYAFAYLLNQDTVVTPPFLKEAVTVAGADPATAAVQSKLLRFKTGEINSWGNSIHFLGFGYAGGNRQPDQPLPVREITYPSGAALLLRLSALQEVGLLDDALFMYHEDLELGWRLWLAGYRCVLAPTSLVYHKYEFSRSVKKYYWMERNRLLVILTHYRLPTLLLILPASLLTDLGLIVQSVTGGFWREELAAHVAFLKPSTWVHVIGRRRRVQRLRKRTDREITSRFTGRIDFQEIPLSLPVRMANAVLGAYWGLVRSVMRW
ncbi:MAG: glycosyltransferase family 2 protein [Patescibacteria group bacterium]|nr:glycosyltransferase family 2 protein [Patescibacteria group bacterium]